VNRPLGLVLRDLLPPAGPRDLLPAATLVEFAALADRLGYDSLWVPEGRGREALTMVAAMAGVTHRARLATGILPVFSRPPALAAMAAATLADLTGGRFVLGVGAGHPRIVEAGYGLQYREPLRAVREFVAIVRAALAGETVTYDGRVFTVRDFQLESRPGHAVPIYLAALGANMLRAAGEIADGVILNWIPAARVPWAVDVVREAARLAGRDPAAVQVVCYVRVAVTDQREAAWAVLRRLVATYAAMPAYAQAFEAAGFVREIQAMNAEWAHGGVAGAAAAAPAEFVEALGAVGPPRSCRERLDEYFDAGADLVAAYPFPAGLHPAGPDAAGSMQATIEALGATSP
jgi:probable F420-dependent oxidoreductase